MKSVFGLLGAACLLLVWAMPASASETSAQNSVTAAPPVSRPTTASCSVTLMNNQPFGVNFNVSPATGSVFFTGSFSPCMAGPWAKVVLDWTGTVQAGRQFDRIAALWIGQNEVLRTSTPEPSAASSVTWHVDKDVSEYAALFTPSQTVAAQLTNYITGPYTSTIFITATLTFYAPSSSYPAAAHPDAVIPISTGSPTSPWWTVSDATAVGSTVTLPTDLSHALLEVYATPHICDEFWYANPPPDYAGPTGSCGTGAFQEIKVLIDGQLAGIAAPFPVLYTGGVNPYLWRPIPPVETFNIRPYAVDLTPFLGVLANGSPHTISIQVPNAQYFWLVDGDLLLSEHGGGPTTGAVTTRTTPDATVHVSENINQNGAQFETTASHDITVAGYVNTPAGRVVTSIQQSLAFSNDQVWNLVNFLENVRQTETFSTTITTTDASGHTTVHTVADSFPLTMSSAFQIPQKGNGTEFILPATIDQTFGRTTTTAVDGATTYSSSLADQEHAQAILIRSLSTGQNQVANGQTTESYIYSDSAGACYNHFLAAAQGAVTADTLKSKC
jgi:hypothetical protein